MKDVGDKTVLILEDDEYLAVRLQKYLQDEVMLRLEGELRTERDRAVKAQLVPQGCTVLSKEAFPTTG